MSTVSFQYHPGFCLEVRLLSPGVFSLVTVKTVHLSGALRLRTGVVMELGAGALAIVSSSPNCRVSAVTMVLPPGLGHLQLGFLCPPTEFPQGQELAILSIVAVVPCGLGFLPPVTTEETKPSLPLASAEAQETPDPVPSSTDETRASVPACSPPSSAVHAQSLQAGGMGQPFHPILHIEAWVHFVGEVRITEQMVREVEQFVRNYFLIENVFYSVDCDASCPMSCVFFSAKILPRARGLCVRVLCGSHNILRCDFSRILSDFIDVLRFQGNQYGGCIADGMYFV
ncbi:E4 ORFD [Murine adenovirus 3]|uniref:E4 ORFD n=1 Tax=Murine adenovirus 3 TaxID=573199 RepID=C3SAV7_9ADEN|nr:E4 ORFD [Murine adenovirus 3]ACJ14527.1 E4 ORFD [Murine adenovirus 3]